MNLQEHKFVSQGHYPAVKSARVFYTAYEPEQSHHTVHKGHHNSLTAFEGTNLGPSIV